MEQLRCDIEVYDLQRGTMTRLVSDGDSHYPVWTPDGQRITYESGRRVTPDEFRSQLVWQLANGGGSEEILATAQGPVRPASLSWSRSGELAFEEQGDIWLLPRSGEGKPRPFAPSRFREMMPAFSPDGRWLAYVSDESGRFEVYVRPFPGPGERYPISTAGGSEPVWARSGQELFFREGDQLMAVEIVSQPSFRAGRPRLLFNRTFVRAPGNKVNYDVSPDGATFVMVNPGEEDRPATQIDVLLTWHEELKRLVPVK